ncbi:response regulator [Alkalinema pantanalense CENA528]|uniref:hybrid sensor histidine kinase/response regulator n=1 Tax=Alkalinema pantanalense TaxID=1620705 RepID=UPI003D6FAC1F
MDKELEIKRQFLDEAQAYLDTLDTAIFGIADQRVDLAKINAALRAAHSIKGGAGMMGFGHLSDLAHQLEDGLKALKLQRSELVIDASLENQFFQAIDYLRQVIEQHRSHPPDPQHPNLGEMDAEIDREWLDREVLPSFAALRDRVGHPGEEDAASILGPEDGQDIAALLFETEVEGCLQRLEAVLADANQPCLREEVNILAQELGGLGEMLQLSAFTALCHCVGRMILAAVPEQVDRVARVALAHWRSSQSLVLSGQRSTLPTQLTGEGLPTIAPEIASDWASPSNHGTAWDAAQILDLRQSEAIDSSLASRPALHPDSGTLDSAGLDALTANSPEVNSLSWDEAIAAAQAESWIIDSTDAAARAESSTTALHGNSEDELWSPASVDPSSRNAPSLNTASLNAASLNAASLQPWEVKPDTITTIEPVDEDATVRVSVRYLNQLNDLFGELAIERNGLDLYLKRLRSLSKLLRDRIKQLNQANNDVRAMYDRGSLGQLQDPRSGINHPVASRAISFMPSSPAGQRLFKAQSGRREDASIVEETINRDTFDVLELDRYGDLHGLSQELIETIVQLQEVATDLDLGLDDAEQTTRDLNKTTKQLQSRLSQLRMRPLSDITDRFPRALRELSLQHNKTVRLQVQGSNLLIDRNILEALQDPLMHLLRNAFDHGIESPQLRLNQGKPEEGCIEISATHRGNRTLITLRDDGGGISLHKIRQRAVDMGLDRTLLATASEADLLSLIFEPGFSTSDTVTQISGRGIGMDVVRENLKQIRGEISVQTQAGEGTTFVLSIPYTLSITRILLVESADMLLALPNDAVEEIILLQPDSIETREGRRLLWHQGEWIPAIQLSEWLHFNCNRQPQTLEAPPTINADAMLITRRGTEKVGIQISRCWGEQEVASRGVTGPLKLPTGFSNCTILGDGRVVPLVNMGELLQWISVHERMPHPVIWTMGTIAQPPTSPKRPALLVVDDSINVRRFLALTLERAGYRVEQAKDGQDALDKLKGGLQVAAVICDVEMPRLDGFGLLSQLKSDHNFKALPIAMLTSRSGEKHRRIATGLGANAYFTKPYNEQELLKTLQTMVQIAV